MRKLFAVLCSAVVLSGCSTTPELRLKSADMTMTLTQSAPAIGSVAVSSDMRYVLSGSRKESATLWDVNNAAGIKIFHASRGFPGQPLWVSFSPDTRYVLTGGRGVKVWNIATGKEERKLGNGQVEALVWSPDGQQILTAGSLDPITLWNWNSGTSLWTTNTGAPFAFVWSAAISPDGQYLLTGRDGTIVLSDLKTNRLVKSAKADDRNQWVGSVTFSPDGRRAASAGTDRILRIWDIPALTISMGIDAAHADSTFSAIFSPDGRFVLTAGHNDGTIKIWDAGTGELTRVIEVHSASKVIAGGALAFSKDGKFLISGGDASTRIWDYATGEEIATLISFEDGEWLVMTPNGYYNASEKGDQYLKVTVGGQPYSIAQLRESFYRPDLVKVALSGGSLKEFRRIAEIKAPPTVAIVDTPASIGTLETTVTVKVTDAGGGIGDVRLYLNGSAVVLDSSRGIALTPTAGTGAVVKKYTVKLAQGSNALRAIAFNGDNSMQSGDALHQIVSTYQPPSRPTLHALVIGINQYKNPKLELNYAVADAKLFADTLQQAAAPLFGQVKVTRLLTREETTQEHILKTLNGYRALNPDDLFVFFVASHGTVDDGEYFLLSSNVGSTSTAKLKTDAISQNALKEAVANIPATKKLIVIDTCNAGHLGDAIQTAMLTRGMSEDTAIKVLSRAVGSTILSASTSVQEALEGYKGHGLFTYVLADGLKGKADKGRTGFVKTTELADYVDNEVPALAEQVFNRAQYPTVSISGQAFPIGQVQ